MSNAGILTRTPTWALIAVASAGLITLSCSGGGGKPEATATATPCPTGTATAMPEPGVSLDAFAGAATPTPTPEPDCPDGSDVGSDDGGGGQVPPLEGTARVTLEVMGLRGLEESIADPYYVVADAPITRDEAATAPNRGSCHGEGPRFSCQFDVPVGQYVSAFGREVSAGGGGLVNNETPVDPSPGTNEFVRWSGDCTQTPDTGDCVLEVTEEKEYTIRAEYQLMYGLIIDKVGAGEWYTSFEGRDVLGVPAFANPLAGEPPRLSSTSIQGPDPVPVVEGWFLQGTKVTLEAQGQNQSKFLRWTGD